MGDIYYWVQEMIMFKYVKENDLYYVIMNIDVYRTIVNGGISALTYNTINILFECFQSKKLALNSTSMVHATYATMLAYFNNHKMTRINSGGYFMFDIFYMLNNRKFDTLRGLYFYHHLASIYLISLNHNQYNWINIIFWSELSNIPNYLVYYIMKKRERFLKQRTLMGGKRNREGGINIHSAMPFYLNDKWIRYVKMAQAAYYGVFRIGLMSYLTYKEVFNPDTPHSDDDDKGVRRFIKLTPVIPVYFMGLLWSGAMIYRSLGKGT